MRDFLKDNLEILCHKSPELCSLIKNAPHDNQYNITTSRSGIATLSRVSPDGTKKSLHSKYDPKQEATQFIDAIYSDESSNYILIGLGLGYHLNDLHKRVSSQDRIIIFEKNPTLVRLAFSQNNFSEALSNPGVSIHIDTDPSKIEQILYEDRTNLAIHGYTPIHLKPLVNLERDYYKLINLAIEQAHQKFKLDINTQAAYSQKFYKNIFNNGLAITESPGIVTTKDIFSNIPTIIVSAGPSLDKNIGLIKSVRKQILVITVSTALKPLLRNGIKPDFVITIDPNEDTIRSFDIKAIPEDLWLIYDPCIPPEICSLFNQRKIMMESKIELAKWITDHSEKKGTLGNISSVAHAAFYLAQHMGCAPIILVGQDLSFEGHRMHCTDSFYNQANQDNIGADRTLDVLEYNKYRGYTQSITPTVDIFDHKSKTTKAMETYKYQLKKEMNVTDKILNATEGGVNIPGAINISLKEAIIKHCQKNKLPTVNDYLKKIKLPTKNKSLLASIRKQLDKFDKIKKVIKKIEDKYLINNKQTIDERGFVLEMESFYVDLLKDKTTTAIMQGYDYIAFVEWNQKTKRINNTASKSSASDSIQKKNLRDRVFIVRLSKTIDFLTHGFRNLENQLC